jgi:hypothetical protein
MIGLSRSSTNKGYDRDFGLPGIMGPTGAEWPSTAGSVQANRASLVRIAPSRTMKIKSIRFVVTVAAGSDDACDVGIYDSAGNRLVSKGAVTGQLNSTGVKTIEIAETTLEAGKVYFLALSVGAIGTTAAQLVSINNNTGMAGDVFGAGTLANRLCPFVNASHPLPAGPVAASGSAANPWLVGAEI